MNGADRYQIFRGEQRRWSTLEQKRTRCHFGFVDEPTAALGVRESNQVLDLIKQLRHQRMPVILISHNMPHVFEVADRIHIQRLGRRAGVVYPATTTMEEAVAVMTGAKQLGREILPPDPPPRTSR